MSWGKNLFIVFISRWVVWSKKVGNGFYYRSQRFSGLAWRWSLDWRKGKLMDRIKNINESFCCVLKTVVTPLTLDDKSCTRNAPWSFSTCWGITWIDPGISRIGVSVLVAVKASGTRYPYFSSVTTNLIGSSPCAEGLFGNVSLAGWCLVQQPVLWWIDVFVE